MLDISRIRGICFDVDGTLSDTDDVFVHRLNGCLKPVLHIFPSWDSLSFSRRLIMKSETPATFLHGLPDRVGVDKGISLLVDNLYRIGIGRSPEPFTLVPGVLEMLGRLSERYPLSVVSARGEKSVERFLHQFEMHRYFKSIATAQTCKRTKPDPSQIVWAAEQMNISPLHCVMVGDTTVDMEAGKSAGAQTVGVLCGFGEEGELLKSGADLILAATPDLVDHLQ